MGELQTYEELVKSAIDKIDGFIGFDGNNCDECEGWDDGPRCRGWNGVDHRCDCRNRRVSWVLSDDGKYVYGEAY